VTRLCAVVPAAGRGTRVGVDAPKVLMPLAPGVTVWSLLRDRLRPHVDRIALVLSPEGAALFARDHLPHEPEGSVEICVQPAPLGMGDAVFCAEPSWAAFDGIVVVWGDQVGVSAGTIGEAALGQRAASRPSIRIPLVDVERPYVQYDFDRAEGASGAGEPDAAAAGRRLVGVRQSREGDACDAHGLADVGCFSLSTAGLAEAWRAYTGSAGARAGRVTGELNFLPFLAFLSAERGWPVVPLPVRDPGERFGINTPDELAFFRARLATRA
jgi:bifunctional UDP-N-acetylglucosamine pyrophosphorylase / glucosamine-1-phosphate N-acetyltransferase